MEFDSEEELRSPVKTWLKSQGYQRIFDEIMWWSKYPDISVIKDKKFILTVELKLHDWKTAFTQAWEGPSPRSYIAMPYSKKELLEDNLDEFDKFQGVGILLVDQKCCVTELREPKKDKTHYSKYAARLKSKFAYQRDPKTGETEKINLYPIERMLSE